MKLHGTGREQLWPNLRYYIGVRLERLKKTARNLCLNSWYLVRDSNQTPQEYKADALPPLEATCSVDAA
jgi:hypothetical protein